MNQLPVLWLIFFHGYPQDGLVSLLHNHMHSCCHILKQKKKKKQKQKKKEIKRQVRKFEFKTENTKTLTYNFDSLIV